MQLSSSEGEKSSPILNRDMEMKLEKIRETQMENFEDYDNKKINLQWFL